MSTGGNYKSVSQSSILQLKAEILKKRSGLKQGSVKNLRLDPNFIKPAPSVDQPLPTSLYKSPEIAGPEKAAQIDDAIQLSLTKKAEKYRKLLLESTFEDYDPYQEDFLVDFSRMPVKDTEELLSRFQQNEENNEIIHATVGPHHISLNDDLEEIVDEFGRTRMVPHHEAVKIRQSLESNALSSPSKLPVEDEILDSHYSEDFEVRTKSVAFYRFSSNEKTRQEQMSALRALEHLSEAQRAAMHDAMKLRDEEQQRRREFILKKRAELMLNVV